jgi:catechol 2,3-dioxygenase-like lactoylglutathione lyase family enzyme
MRTAHLSLAFLAVLACQSARAHEPVAARFHHVHLNVTDPARTIAYYMKIHGATLIKYRNKVDSLFTERSFILFNTVAQPAPNALEAGIWHIGWGGRDVPSEYEWFKQQGAKIRVELYPLRNIWVTYLSGPDDEMIEVNTMGHNRFGHVHLLAEDVNTTTEWYARHLGVSAGGETVPKPADMQSVRAWSRGFRCDNVSFVVYGRPDYTPAPPWWQDPPLTAFKPTDGRVIDHIAFSYRDIEPVFERMKANGVEIVKPITLDTALGHSSFFVRGPDQVLIEIVEDKPVPEGIWE